MKTVRILGTRGLPAEHGGFETFAEHLAIYLKEKGWRVIVYCQLSNSGPIYEDTWQGIERVNIPVAQDGPKGTIIFDWKATSHASRFQDLCLTLGYNTAIFSVLLRLKGITNLFNMDGVEWKRQKWSGFAKLWFWLNDWAGCWLGNHLIADHPQIKEHLMTRVSSEKITMIPYGADLVSYADKSLIESLGLAPGEYLTVIARAEPENSLLEIVKGFSSQKRGCKLAVLGNYSTKNKYHNLVKSFASDEVVFLGAIYDKTIVQALRYHCLAYIHGHQVGGTNPSLVEAMGAGNAIIAHDNKYNRWVIGESARYFSGDSDFSNILNELLLDSNQFVDMKHSILERYKNHFTWEKILSDYEQLLEKYSKLNKD